MSNKAVICAFVAGFCGGAIAGFAYAKYTKVIDSNIDISSNEPSDKNEGSALPYQETSNSLIEGMKQKNAKINNETDTFELPKSDNKTQKQVDEMLAENESPSDDEPEDEKIPDDLMDIYSSERRVGAKSSPTKIITADSFGTDTNYDTCALLYYKGNDVLTNEDGEVINDVSLWVGDCLTKYDFLHNQNQDVLYIRNKELQMDLEVYKLESEYAE